MIHSAGKNVKPKTHVKGIFQTLTPLAVCLSLGISKSSTRNHQMASIRYMTTAEMRNATSTAFQPA